MTKQTSLSNAQLARWANLPLVDRIADRFAAILFAAEQIGTMIDVSEEPDAMAAARKVANSIVELVRPMLPTFRNRPCAYAFRDPELEEVLVRLDNHLARIDSLRGRDFDEALERVERIAAPYALAFHSEIRSIDSCVIWGSAVGVERDASRVGSARIRKLRKKRVR